VTVFVGKKPFVGLKGSEADGHLGHYPGYDGTEACRERMLILTKKYIKKKATITLVEPQDRLALDNHCTCFEEPSWLLLGYVPKSGSVRKLFLATTNKSSRLKNQARRKSRLTPFCRLLSCIRTLMVSRGWQTHASASPAIPPATRWMPSGVFALVFFPLPLPDMVPKFVSSVCVLNNENDDLEKWRSSKVEQRHVAAGNR
jgi:hypothetical protein